MAKKAKKTHAARRRPASGAAVHRKRPRARKARSPKVVARAGAVTVSEVEEIEQLRRELERAGSARSPLRWNADPEDVQKSVAQLVLTLIEFVRRLLERQAIRRMEAGTLSDQQTEDVGLALMKLEETVRDIAAKFGLEMNELNLDLGPVGTLM